MREDLKEPKCEHLDIFCIKRRIGSGNCTSPGKCIKADEIADKQTIAQQAKELDKLKESERNLFHALQYMINNSGEPRNLETIDGFARAEDELKRASASLAAQDLLKRNETIEECAIAATPEVKVVRGISVQDYSKAPEIIRNLKTTQD